MQGDMGRGNSEGMVMMEGMAEALMASQVKEVASCLRAVARSYESLKRIDASIEPPNTTVADLLALADKIETAFEVIVLLPPLDPRRN